MGRRGHVVGVLLIGDDSVDYTMAAVLSLEVGVLPFQYVDNFPRVHIRNMMFDSGSVIFYIFRRIYSSLLRFRRGRHRRPLDGFLPGAVPPHVGVGPRLRVLLLVRGAQGRQAQPLPQPDQDIVPLSSLEEEIFRSFDIS